MESKGSWGGRRPGSGRKPKSVALANGASMPVGYPGGYPAVLECPDMPLFPGLNAKQVIFVVKKTRGVATAKLCRELGVAEKTGHRWEKTAWYKQAFQEELDRLAKDIQRGLMPLLPKALEVLEHNLDKGDRRAAEDVMDRVYGKPTQRVEEDGEEKRVIEIKIGIWGQKDDENARVLRVVGPALPPLLPAPDDEGE